MVEKAYIFLVATHMPEAVVMLLDAEGKVVQQKRWVADKTLGVKLLEAFDELLGLGKISWDAVKRIGIHVGPGHYSALRAGVITVSMIAQEKNIELVEVDRENEDEWRQDAVQKQPTEVVVPRYS